MLFAALRPQETENEDGLPLWPAGMVLLAGCTGLVYESISGALFSGLVIFLLLFATSAVYFLKTTNKSSVRPAGEERLEDAESRKQKTQDSKEKLFREINALKASMKARAKKMWF